MIVLIAAICLLTTVWPGDVPFINDEPSFIYKALRANENHELARSGLVGSRGIPYGPLPVWMYQAMLLVTHDLIAITVIHALLMSGTIAFCLLWLSRSLRLNPWFAAAVLVSPYTWFYNRALWDSLNLPLTSLAMAAYASFLARAGKLSLAIFLGCLALLPMVHLMALAFVVPAALHLLVFRWRQMVKVWPVVVGVLVGGAVAWIPYMRALATEHGNVTPMHGLAGWWFPLLGARLISGANLAYLFTPGWMNGAAWLYPAWAISLLAYPLMWIGLFACALTTVRVVRRRTHADSRDLIAVLALSIICAQIVLDGVGHISAHPHYYNGTWIVFPLLTWLGFDLVVRRAPLFRAVLPVYTTALVALTAFIAIRIHTNHGVRSLNYGLALGDEIRVVRELNARGVHGPFAFISPDGQPGIEDNFNWHRSKAEVATNIPNFLLFPHSLNLIQEMIDPGEARESAGARLGIELRPAHPGSVDVRVIELPPGESAID